VILLFSVYKMVL